MAFADAEHAVTTHDTGPRRWCSIDANPAAMLGMIWGMAVGLTRPGPLESSIRTSSMNEPIPPNPAPTTTPDLTVSGSSSAYSRPASAIAWRTATRKNWV